MNTENSHHSRKGHCPVYDIECPSGSEAAESCEMRFQGDYNPLTSFRDAEIEHCAIYRKDQADQNQDKDLRDKPSNSGEAKESQ